MLLLTATQIRERVPALTDAAKFTDATLEDLIVEFTDIAEQYRGVSYVQRQTTETRFISSNVWTLELWNRPARLVTSLTVDGNAIAAADYTLDPNLARIYGQLFLAGSTVVVSYTYGIGTRQVADGATTDTDQTVTSATANFGDDDIGTPVSGTGIPTGTTIASVTSATAVVLSAAATATGTGVTITIGQPPKALQRACREYVRSCALADKSGVPRDVIGQSFGDGSYTRFSTPDWNAGRPTGWLEVDRLLNSLDSYFTYSA